jgi:molecular chaperone DnaK
MIKEAGDKISASDRQPVESAIEDLKKAIEKNDVAEMKRGMESLNAAQHKIAEAMYKAAQASGAPEPGAQTGEAGQASSAKSGDVIDAEVVEEEKK